jgi:HEAT repeat protein
MTTVEYLLQHLTGLSDNQLKREYLNYLKWTEAIAQMLQQLDEESQPLRVVRLALEVDLMLGAKLAGSVKPEFQTQALSLITELDIPQPLKAELNALAHQNKFASKTAVQVSETNFRDFEIPSQSRDLQQGNSEVRFNAAHALGQIGSENAIAALRQALSHNNVRVRTLAIAALGKIKRQAATTTLIQALADENSAVKQSAVVALGKISGEAAVPVLVQVLDDRDAKVRQKVVETLGNINSEALIPILTQALGDADSNVGQSAADALGKIRSEAAAPALIKIVERQHCMLRDRAIIALGEIGSDAAVPALIRVLEDKGDSARFFAAQVLGKIGSKSAISALVMALITEDNLKVSSVVATALQKIGIPELLPHLSDILLTRSLYKSNSKRAYDWYDISYVPHVMTAIQRRCGYYNYGLMQPA